MNNLKAMVKVAARECRYPTRQFIVQGVPRLKFSEVTWDE